MYAIEIYDGGKYNNICGNYRLFATKRGAINFSNSLDRTECSHRIFKVTHLVGDCFGSGYEYIKEIDMIEYENGDYELNPVVYAIMKFLGIYDRDKIEKYYCEDISYVVKKA